jgi:hypothetical protein
MLYAYKTKNGWESERKKEIGDCQEWSFPSMWYYSTFNSTWALPVLYQGNTQTPAIIPRIMEHSRSRVRCYYISWYKKVTHLYFLILIKPRIDTEYLLAALRCIVFTKHFLDWRLGHDFETSFSILCLSFSQSVFVQWPNSMLGIWNNVTWAFLPWLLSIIRISVIGLRKDAGHLA